MKKLLILLVTALTGFALLAPVAASAQFSHFGTASSEDACETLKDINPDNRGCNAAGGGVNRVIKLTLHLLSIAAGFIAVIMIIVSGFKYVTAQGDPNQISSAKNALIYAIVGLVVVVFAQMIVEFVLRRAT